MGKTSISAASGIGRNVAFAALVFVLLAGQVFAASTGPLIRISSYVTVPSEVYPGTHGYLQVTVENDGDSTAQSVSANYNLNGMDSTISIGDVAAGSTAQIAVPFQIDPSSAGSIQLVNVQIYYSYASTSGTSSSTLPRTTSLSVPLTVQQYKPLDVVLTDTSTVTSPGDKIVFDLNVTNTGGVINNLVVGTPNGASFTLYGSTEQQIVNIPLNSTVQVPLEMVSSSTAATGTYAIPLIFTYQDALKQPTNETYELGPITVLQSSSKYRLTFTPLDTVEIGAQVPFELTLENAGTTPMTGTIAINTTSVFTPIGVQTAYFDSVPAGQNSSQVITMGIAAAASSGYYTIPLTLTTEEGQTAVYVSGVVVEATPELTVSLDTSGTTPQIQVANTGNSQIRSVHVAVTATGSSSPTDSFLGTLNVDDFSSVSVPSGAGRSVNVVVTFKDSNNAEHTMNQTLDVNGNVSFTSGAPSGFTGNRSAAAAAGGAARNPLGALLGGGRASSSGPNYVLIGIGVVVVAVVGFFAYKRFKKGKKAPAQLPVQLPSSSHDEKGKRK